MSESPNPALDARKNVTAYFPLPCPHEQRAMLDFQVAGCLSARQPRCYGLIGHNIGGTGNPASVGLFGAIWRNLLYTKYRYNLDILSPLFIHTTALWKVPFENDGSNSVNWLPKSRTPRSSWCWCRRSIA